MRLRDTGGRSESLRTMLFSCSGDGAGVTRVTSCLCSFSSLLELGETKISLVGGRRGWRALRGRRKKQELLTDNERGHQGIVLVGVYSFMHEPADVKI